MLFSIHNSEYSTTPSVDAPTDGEGDNLLPIILIVVAALVVIAVVAVIVIKKKKT